MVLAELGGKLKETLRSLSKSSNSSNNDEAFTIETLDALLSKIARALIEADVNVKLVMTLRSNIRSKIVTVIEEQKKNDDQVRKITQQEVIDQLVSLLESERKPYPMKRNKSNIILFVGLQGAGKTTSIAKFANYYQRKGWKTAMVCADTFRAGAFDQLKQNATKLRIPFYGSYTEADPVQIATEGVQHFVKDKYEVILVDSSGRHQQEAALFEEMQEISAAINPHNTVFVMDATQGQAVYDQAMGFSSSVDVGSVIVTKLDGHAKGGGALSAVAATKSPIIFLGSGEHFDDFDPFNARSFVSKLLGFGDVRGLMEEMKAIQEASGGNMNRQEMMEKFNKGQFTLRDMYKQFENVMKMGPMNKIMGMVPGIPEYLIPKGTGSDDEGTLRLKKFMYIMDSMTDAELDGKVNLHKKMDPAVDSRIKRIAIGSGTHPLEVRLLLQCHKQFEGMVSKVGKSGMMGGKGGAHEKQIAEAMKRNPNALMQQISRNMDPKLIEQMGGTQNIMNMMKQMGGGQGGGGGLPGMMGGMPGMMGGGVPGMGGMDMESMMKQMSGMMGGGMGGGGGMPPMPAGMDMNKMAQMMQQMGMGGGMPGMRR